MIADGRRRPQAPVLIADDQREVREALRLMLKAEGFETETAGSPAEILQAVTSRDFDAVLMDLNYARDTTSGREGLDLLDRLRAVDDALPVVVMTAWASVDVAVEAMRRGARDFVEKPWDNARLLRDPAHPDRPPPGAAPRPAAGGRERAPARDRRASRS